MRGLPSDAAVVRAGTHGWSYTDELAAQQLELAHQQLVAFLSAHGVKRLPKPLQVSRPWRPAPPKRQASAADVAQLLGAV